MLSMENKHYRKRLTIEEYNAILDLTSATKLDSVFDITELNNTQDCFINYEEKVFLELKNGLELLYSCLAYPLKHNGLTDTQAKLIYNLFIEFDVETKERLEWLLEDE